MEKQMKKDARESLPENAETLFAIDLKKNRKQFWLINGISALIAVPLLAILLLLVWFQDGWAIPLGEDASVTRLIAAIVLLVSLFVYIVLHELVHGIFFRLYSGKRPKYGFNVAFAYAYHTDYFRKGAYLWIGLSPVVIWGVVLAVLCFVLPAPFRLVAYIIQLANLSGAAGDFYVTVKLLKTKGNVWIKDDGCGMTVYRLPDEE